MDDDGPNAWIVEKYRYISLDDIVSHEIQAFNAIIAGLEALTEKQLDQHHLFERVTNNTYLHYHEHSRDIERWLASIG